ncbi:MAG: aspartate--tRNA ligase [Lachnospirales bacterium]
MKRNTYCGHINLNDINKELTVAGWVLNKRDMGGIIFIDLRDREGVLQVVFDAENLSEDDFQVVESLKNQSVIYVKGKVRERDEETVNPKIETGYVELKATELTLESTSLPIPFSLEDDVVVREDLRLKYRYLDLRRPAMINNLRLRHKIQRITQNFLDNKDFISVDTPLLTKSTPEGARDYLVPSRVHEGKFFALPQSPQIFKQLLMVGGIDKYYQVAKCLRDEDLRADRQPEFTQVDLEMSFVNQEDVLVLLEELFKEIMREIKNINLPSFQRITWHEAMDVYGSDKPDLRFELPIVDLTEIARTCSFSVFRSVVDGGGIVRAINVKGGNAFTRNQINELTDKAMEYGAKGMAWISLRDDGEVYSILTKYFSDEDIENIIRATKAENGDFILFCADKLNTVRNVLGRLRLDLGDMLDLRDPEEYKFLIVTDFPQFEWAEDSKRYISTHHPFTMPYDEDVKYLLDDNEKGKVRAQAYDFVLNGTELGSGSVRIHKADVQQIMFESLGFSKKEINERFGFMVNAFRYGTPPHAGFAFGLDRLVMLLVGANSLREVIAFPKTKEAICLLTDAPNYVDIEQLEELNLGTAIKIDHSTENEAKEKELDIDVDKVADLAKLFLSKEEKKNMKKTLTSIINFADTLSNIDTTGVDVTAHIMPIDNVFREDEVTSTENRTALLSNSKTKTNEYIYVPNVIG